MWLLTFLLPSISILRSLSWGALALSFLLLLVGLFVWNSNIWTLSTLTSKLNYEATKNTVQILKDGQPLPYVPQELLTRTVTQLADAALINNKKVALVCVTWFLVAGTSLWLEIKGRSIDTYKNVHVLKRFDDFNFQMEVQDPDTKLWNPFGVTFCDDYLPTDEIQPGVTLTLLKGEYDQRTHCFEIAPRNLGYTILRGDHNVPIIATRGQTAASSETTTTKQTN